MSAAEMQVDAALTVTDLLAVPKAAPEIEALGYDGIFTFEGPHDPFFPLLLAAEHTERVQLTTAVAIGFARNPMTLAHTAYDLQLASHGRFRLGLGTQIKPHIEKRFSMPWSKPVDRMREMVLAIRAIWANWHEGTPLAFEGEFYRHTLMTPFFNPGPSPYGLPSIFLAGVGPRMTEMAGEVADGFIVHPFATERSLRELTIPAVERGAARAGRSLADVEVAFPLMAIVADDDEQLEQGRAAMRPRLAFYGSTPAYKVILDVHGWGDLQPELNRLSKTGDWATMSALITDEMVDAFSVQGTPETIGGIVRGRYGDLVQRVSFDTNARLDPERARKTINSLRT
jgi:probable F420-dependent oxidoreductase